MEPSSLTRSLRALLAAVALSSATASALLSPLATTAAEAGSCGDDIEGARVPCSCGDFVVSDTRLAPGDPVVSMRCPLDGLIVSAPANAASITLDLAGLTLHGDPYGIGIRVASGGSDGARILGGGHQRAHATILGFSTGIEATGSSLAWVSSLEVVGARRDGLDLRGRGIVALDLVSRGHGGDGLRLTGSGGRLSRVIAEDNRGSGIVVLSEQASIEALAQRNDRDGIVVRARRASLEDARAFDNGGAGIVAPRARRPGDRDRTASAGNAEPDLRHGPAGEGGNR